jgi:hypothetical protein
MAKTDKANKGIKNEQEGGSTGPLSLFDPSLPMEIEGQERFLLEVLNRKSNVRAYQLAYPDSNYNSAAASSTRLLRDDKVQARLEFLKKEQRDRLRMSADDVVMRIEMAASFDPGDLFNADGSIIPIHQLPAEVRLCLEKVEYDEIVIDGRKIGRTAKVTAISKKSSLEMLARHYKLLTDKIDITLRRSLEDILNDSVSQEATE